MVTSIPKCKTVARGKDTAQVSLWLCKSATVQDFFINRVDRDPPPKP